MLNNHQIELVQNSFAKVAPIADVAARLFYERMFVVQPSFRPMFPADLTEQRSKLMKTLALAVAGLTKVEKVVPALQTMGRRHVAYGVEDWQYDVVGSVLIWTLGQGLGDDFTDEVREAWVATYTIVAGVMKAAAAEAMAEAKADVARLNARLEREHEYNAPHAALMQPFESDEFQQWLQSAAVSA